MSEHIETDRPRLDRSFWRGRRVLVTGHTGFKGSWLSLWLSDMGAEVTGVSLDPPTRPSLYERANVRGRLKADLRVDIRDAEAVRQAFRECQPEVTFHLAAQPLVRLSYREPEETYATNVMGTVHVLEALREQTHKRVAVMITTDKCYENRERAEGYREDEPMGGHDPYSSSKGCCELAISSWRRSFFSPSRYSEHQLSLCSARAGNVVGGGDWALDRIVPDCIRALQAGEPISIRSPRSVRPWQHVLEPLSGYLLLAQSLWREPTARCEGWNFGPAAGGTATVWQVATTLCQAYGADPAALRDAADPNAPHEANLLTLDITKARTQLGWQPRLTLGECLAMTAEWYRRALTEPADRLCLEQIHHYESL